MTGWCLKSGLLASSILGALVIAGGARAQVADEAVSTVDEIVVTGSRIRRVEVESNLPVGVITAEQMNRRGYLNVADAINDLPTVGMSDTPKGDQDSSSVGRNYVNLFGLGSQRTLTLVNGRRMVGANPASAAVLNPGGQVDLNTIPSALIARVETIQGGGASVYGSDAIAGVVNVILKDDFEGLRFDVQAGISDYGDAFTNRVQITAGRNFQDGRGNAAVSFEHSENDSLVYPDRWFTNLGLGSASNPANTGPNDGIPANIRIFDHRMPEFNASGVLFRIPAPVQGMVLGQFNANGDIVPYDKGTYYNYAYSAGGDGYRISDVTSLMSEVKRDIFSGIGHYDLTDRIKVTGELLYSKVEAVEPVNQGVFNTTLQTGSNAAIPISTTNPFLSAQAQSVLAGAGVTRFFLSRANEDLVADGATARSSGETARAVVGLEGDFDALGRNFFWNVSANVARSEGYFSAAGINEKRFRYALDATRDGSNKIVCAANLAGSTDPDAAGCVPIHLFGAGGVSDEARAYLAEEYRQDFEMRQTDILANLGGDLFQLPAGPLSFVVGLEYRKEESTFTPNTASRLGLGRGEPIAPVSGEFDTREVYGEFLAPLVSPSFNLPLVHRLELEGSYRFVDHSLSGKDEAWSIGGRWSPVSDLTFRASQSRTFRAPALLELFLPRSTVSAAGLDPCDIRNIGAGSASRMTNCQAMFTSLGLPANYELTSIAQNVEIPVSLGGNQNLKNEVADSTTVGLIYEPAFIPGLTLTADWMKVDIEDAIVNFDLEAIMLTCYDATTPSADICDRLERGNDAQIVNARTGYVNAGYTNFEGISYVANYNVPLESVFFLKGLSDPGQLNLNLSVFNLKKLETSVSGLGFDLNRDAGEIGLPEWQWRLGARYAHGSWGFNWNTTFIDESVFDNAYTSETRDYLTVASYYRHDISVQYEFNDRYAARVGINNLLNEAPPLGAGASGGYDVLGRYFFMGLTAQF